MKQLQKISRYLIIALVAITYSCDKELDITENNFSFTGYMLPETPIQISEKFTFIMNLDDSGFTQGNAYQIKYSSDKNGVFSLATENNDEALIANEYKIIPKGSIKAYYTSNIGGVHNLKITITNSKNQSKELLFACVFNNPVFTLSTPITSFTSKESDTVNIPVKIIGYSNLLNYQVKAVHTVVQNSPISDFLNNINANIPSTFAPALVEADGTVNLKYLNHSVHPNLSVLTDQWIISVTDGVTTKSLTFNFTLKPLPKVTNSYSWVKRYREPTGAYYYGYFYDISGSISYGAGVTITEYEFSWKNSLTGTYHVYHTKSIQPTISADNTGFYYVNQECKARVKDSEGYWSPYFIFNSVYVIIQ